MYLTKKMFEEVYIDIRKLRDYVLNPQHPIGKHKARVFSSSLGISRNEAEILKTKIVKEMEHADIVWAHEDQFGKRFKTDLEISMNDREARVRTIWIIKVQNEIPELVTCYVII